MKRLIIDLDGVEGCIKNGTLIVSSAEPLLALSSAVLGGGFQETSHIINHHVNRDFSHNSPERLLNKVALELNIRDPVVGMLTAADLDNLSLLNLKRWGLKITSVITGGISNAAQAGDDLPVAARGEGTINTILLVDGRLTHAAMVGAVITITEAKTAGLRELDVKSAYQSGPATGTTTDSVVVACTGRGDLQRYAGTGTKLGALIGGAVKEGTIEAVKRQEGWH